MFFTALLNSVEKLPATIRDACTEIYNLSEKKQPGSGYQMLGGFFFLRFLCPAIVAPHIYFILQSHSSGSGTLKLRDKLPSPKVKRGLVLVAKIFQTLSNGGTFQTFDDDAFVIPINEWIRINSPLLKQFYNDLTETPKIKHKKVKGKTSEYKCALEVMTNYLTSHYPALRESLLEDDYQVSLERLKRVLQIFDQEAWETIEETDFDLTSVDNSNAKCSSYESLSPSNQINETEDEPKNDNEETSLSFGTENQTLFTRIAGGSHSHSNDQLEEDVGRRQRSVSSPIDVLLKRKASEKQICCELSPVPIKIGNYRLYRPKVT